MWAHSHGLETDLILNTPVYPGSVGERLPRWRWGVISLLERALPGRPTLQGWYDREGSGKVAMALGQRTRCALGSRVFGVRGPSPSVGLLSLLGSSHSSGTLPDPTPLCPQHTSCYSLARMTMSMPQKMLMIQPTITMAVST